MRRLHRIAGAWSIFALAGGALPCSGQAVRSPNPAAAGPGARAGTAAAVPAERDVTELPVCAEPLGSISVVNSDGSSWRDLNLENPDAMLRAIVQQSGCFTLVDRGQGLASETIGRTLPGDTGLQGQSSVATGQGRAADYVLAPGIVRTPLQPTRDGPGRLLDGALGHMLGGLAVKRQEATVSLSMVDVRTTELVVQAQGYARRQDIGSGSDTLPDAIAGSYRNTDLGRTFALAYLDAYKRLVQQARATAASGGPSAGEAPDAPFLPWPPPSPSGLGEVTSWFRPSATLGGLDDQVRARLARRGYETLHHFYVPGGFGVTTDVERINPDGSVSADRWQTGKLPSRGGLLAYLSNLLAGDDARFRLFAFLITDQDIVPDDYKASQMEIDRWKTSGRLFLSRRMGARKVQPGTRVWLLVYEFVRSRSKGGMLVAPEQGGLAYSRHVAFLGAK